MDRSSGGGVSGVVLLSSVAIVAATTAVVFVILHQEREKQDATTILKELKQALSSSSSSISVRRETLGEQQSFVGTTTTTTAAIVEAILRRNPSVLEPGKSGFSDSNYTFLHYIFHRRECLPPFDAIKVLIENGPPAVLRTKALDGCLPLHLACCRPDCTVQLIQLLLKSFPDSLKEKCDNGQTHLHRVCRSDAPMDVIQFLLEQFPEALEEQDDAGNTTIHSACGSNHLRPDVMEVLISNHPHSLRMRNQYGLTPLHYLCGRRNVPLPIIELIYEACPDAATLTDWDGNTPLHSACLLNCYQVVKVLTEKMPSLCVRANIYGALPWDNNGRTHDTHIYNRLECATVSLIAELILVSSSSSSYNKRGTKKKKLLTTDLYPQVAELMADRLDTRPHPTLSELWTTDDHALLLTAVEQNNGSSNKMDASEIYAELNELLHDDRDNGFRDLMESYRLMNQAGRKLYLLDAASRTKGVIVCSSISSSSSQKRRRSVVAGLYLLLRENPSICCKRQATTDNTREKDNCTTTA